MRKIISYKKTLLVGIILLLITILGFCSFAFNDRRITVDNNRDDFCYALTDLSDKSTFGKYKNLYKISEYEGEFKLLQVGSTNYKEMFNFEVCNVEKTNLEYSHDIGWLVAEKETFTNIEIYLIPNCTSLPKSVNPKVTFTKNEESNNVMLNIDKIDLRYTRKPVAKYSESDKLDIIILLFIVVS